MYEDKELQNNVLRLNTLLKAPEVVEISKISRAMAHTLMQRGEITSVRIGKAWRVLSEDLIKYIESNTYTLNKFFEEKS